jgi:hypothetical protein
MSVLKYATELSNLLKYLQSTTLPIYLRRPCRTHYFPSFVKLWVLKHAPSRIDKEESCNRRDDANSFSALRLFFISSRRLLSLFTDTITVLLDIVAVIRRVTVKFTRQDDVGYVSLSPPHFPTVHESFYLSTVYVLTFNVFLLCIWVKLIHSVFIH